jgi:hypothetical protein
MRKSSTLVVTIFGTLTFLFSGALLADCQIPAAPIIPDGNVASQDELVAAQQAMKSYQGSLAEYRVCLDGMQKELDPEAEDTPLKAAEISAKYNSSVDSEAAIAEEFNVAVRAFKSRQ